MFIFTLSTYSLLSNALEINSSTTNVTVEAITSAMSSTTSSSGSSKTASNSTNAATTNPIDITIVSNDVAFFTDTNIDSHKRALTRVWERLRSKFQSNLIRCVSVLIFESKIAALDQPNANATVDTCSSNNTLSTTPNDSKTSSCSTVNVSSSGASSNDGVDSTGSSGSSNPKTTSYSSNHQIDPATPHPFKVAYCVREIQKHIVKLSEKEYKHKERRDVENTRDRMPMNIQLELHDFHPILFTSILQKWSRDVLYLAPSRNCRVCFELPETFDGTQSAVTLDLSYSILPYRLDSPLTISLLEDLKSLNESFVEVVQLVPLDSVDLSLIHGTPLCARAGMEDNLDQYKDMQVLVRALLNYLGSNDVALVLRSSNYDSKHGDDLIQNVTNTRLFLLMAQVDHEEDRMDQEGEERPRTSPSIKNKSKSQYKANGHGMLYHYVDKAEHIMIEERNQNDVGNCADQDDEMFSFSSEYIENSLGMLDCAELNPYIVTTKKTISMFEVNGENGTIQTGHHNSNNAMDVQSITNEEPDESSTTYKDGEHLNRNLLAQEDNFISIQEFYDD